MLFPRRGTLPLTGRSQGEVNKDHCGLTESGEDMGLTRGPALQRTHAHTEAHLTGRRACNPTSNTDLRRCWGEICVERAQACVHTYTELHAWPASKCAHSGAHTGICTAFMC